MSSCSSLLNVVTLSAVMCITLMTGFLMLSLVVQSATIPIAIMLSAVMLLVMVPII